jgi:hypothetical protein
MDELDQSLTLYRSGVWSEAIGPEQEWLPVNRFLFQVRHNQFWSFVKDIIQAEPGEYDDLPEWMTEAATERLQHN